MFNFQLIILKKGKCCSHNYSSEHYFFLKVKKLWIEFAKKKKIISCSLGIANCSYFTLKKTFVPNSQEQQINKFKVLKI